MNIVVCVKWVINPDSAIKVESGAIRELGLFYIVNPGDLVAVEEAVRLKESLGGEVTVVCLGQPQAEKAIRNCFAIGADRGIMLRDDAFNGSDSYATAVALAEVIKRLKYDLVLCGQKAAENEDGQVGAILAEVLNIPLVSSVVKVEVSSDAGKVTVHRKLERGSREVVEADLPALLTVDTALNNPRYPKLRDIFAARKTKITGYNLKALGMSPEQVGVSGSKSIVEAYLPPKPRLKRVFTPSSELSAEERVQALMTGGVAQKKSEFLEGNPESVASTLLQLLEEEKFLESK